MIGFQGVSVHPHSEFSMMPETHAYYDNAVKIHLKYVPYCSRDKHTCQQGNNLPTSGIVDRNNWDEYKNAILLLRNPFEAIYALKLSMVHDKAYYHFLSKGNYTRKYK